MGGHNPKAAVHVWHGTTYYRWIDWCIHHASNGSKSPTFFCMFYNCRVSMIFCKEKCRHRGGY
jgi:hypothetical protein